MDGTDEGSAVHRLGPQGPLVGLLVVVAIVAAAFALPKIVGDSEQSEQGRARVSSQDLPEPRVIERDGVRFKVGPTSPDVIVPDPDDPRVLTVYARDTGPQDKVACSEIAPVARVEAETDTEVRVATFSYTARPTDGEISCAYMTTSEDDGSFSGHAELEIRLDRPLGSRRVVEVTSGGIVGMIPASYKAIPTYVPDGYRKSFTSRYTPSDLFSAMTQYTPKGDLGGTPTLSVGVSPATPAMPVDGKVVERRTMQGISVEIRESRYERCARWAPREGLVADVCSTGKKSDLLPASELMRVARSLPIPAPF